MDTDERPKWRIIWPYLAGLPSNGLNLLDAGCGDGRWSLELAKRRPGWKVTGLDLHQEYIEEARKKANRLSVENVEFLQGNFLCFDRPAAFDAIVSVCSAHYLIEEGKGQPLFARFAEWLTRGGRLIVLVPRKRPEMPLVEWLPQPRGWNACGRQELVGLCKAVGLEIDEVSGRIGRAGAIQKQLKRWVDRNPTAALKWISYPILYGLCRYRDRKPYRHDQKSVYWLLVARSRHD